jgi:hypothetical protein
MKTISFRIPMHFPVHFLLELLLVVVATAAPTGSDSDSNEHNTIPSPPTLTTAGGGKTLQELERGMAAGKMLYFAKTAAKESVVATGVATTSISSGSESDSDMSEQHTTPSPPTVRNARRGKTLRALERGKRTVVAEKMLLFANGKSGKEVEEEEEKAPYAPVLRDPSPKRPASPTADTYSASLPAAKRRMVSESAARARASSHYHLTPIDPAATTVSNIYQEWKYGLLGGNPLFQVDVATQEWQNDPEMLLQYRIRRSIGNTIDGIRQRSPEYSDMDIVADTQNLMDAHNPSTVAHLAAYLEVENLRLVYGDLASGVTYTWPRKEFLPTFQAAPSAARMPMAYSPFARMMMAGSLRAAAVSANAARARPLLSPVRNSRLSLHTANLPKSTYVFNGVEPSNLIELPSPSRGGANGKATVLDVWTVWNEQLRNPDAFHTALIEKYGDGTGIYKAGKRGNGWAEKWFLKYRYYEEVGEEIDRRLAKIDGKSVDQIIGRLEYILNQTYNLKTVKALVEGIRIARGEDPISPARNGKEVDIKDLLEEDY